MCIVSETRNGPGAGLLEDRLGAEADALYAALLDAHAGLGAEESAALNSRLVLILMNALRDGETVRAAIALARKSADRR